MLKITIPIMSMLILTTVSKYWWIATAFLIVMVPIAMVTTMPKLSLLAMSSFSMTDTMSMTLIYLSILIAAMMMSASTKIYGDPARPKYFYVLNIILLFILINCFSSSSLISFYVWFEASLIPTMLIIMTWGYQPERLQASMYLMLYTITASLPMLVLFCMIILYSNTSLMFMNSTFMIPSSIMESKLLWMTALVGFIVKLPMFSVHLWLPKAHVEAPIAGSMVLAAILLKLGGYGLARMISMFYKLNSLNSSMLMSIALSGAAATSIICMRQPDLKSLIAYSSVGHMGLMFTGMLSNSVWGLSSALIMMIAHGLSSSALFILANLSYELTHTRSMFLIKGLLSIVPIMSMWWFLFTAANMAAPPSINLLSEIMLITSIMSKSSVSIILISLISFFTAAYSLHMFSATQHGQISTFSNPIYLLKPKDMLILVTHLLPIILIISMPEIVSSWL